MDTWNDQVREIREQWRKEAEALAARLTDAQLQEAHRELVSEVNKGEGHVFADVLIYITAIRAEHEKRRSRRP